ncbi:MAG: hypothetical protein E6R14_00730 [Thermomicrobiales bacterium]|nr:MAG: hypothetical protein E6R14_00730 [Thermomicrobiales bacterium]
MFDEQQTFPDPEVAIETWLRTEVIAAYDELRSDPSHGVSSAELRARLEELHEQQVAELSS